VVLAGDSEQTARNAELKLYPYLVQESEWGVVNERAAGTSWAGYFCELGGRTAST